MKGVFVVLGVLLAVVLGIGGCGVTKYNGIVGKKESVDAQWVEIRNQYKRRADLIPNIVKTVQGASDFERETLEAVIEKRQQVTNIQVPDSAVTDPAAVQKFLEAQQGLSSALTRLLAVSERYPDLKSLAAFRDLTVALEGTENRIAVARRDYVESVKVYNVSIKQFPANVIAGMFNFDAASQLEIEGEDLETAPTVDFGK